jgi:copper transport protein
MNLRYAAAVLLLLGAVTPASARPQLEQASPSAGSNVRRPPAQVGLSFNQVLLPSGTDAVVRSVTGAVVSSAKARVVGNKTQLQVPLNALEPGKYRVEWFATSADKSHSQGSFTFTVGEPSGAAARAQSLKKRRR